MSFLKVELCCC